MALFICAVVALGCGAKANCVNSKSYVVLKPPPNLPTQSTVVVKVSGASFAFTAPCPVDQDLGGGVHLQCTESGWILGPKIGANSAARASVSVSGPDGTALLTNEDVVLSTPAEMDPDGDPGYCESLGTV
jgi:hypothetical protein